MAHFVYILQSMRDSKYDIGETTDVEKRLLFHNSGKQRSTGHRIPFRLVLAERFSSRTEALQRENQIKTWKRRNAFKILIAGR